MLRMAKFLILTVVSILSFIIQPSTSIAENYLPAFSGMRMEYVNHGHTGEHVNISVAKERNGWYLFEGFPGLMGKKVWIRPSQDGKLYMWNDKTKEANVYVNFNVKVGTTNSHSGIMCSAGTVVKNFYKELTISSGTFFDVTEIHFFTGPRRCYDTGVENIFFAKDVGIIKWQDTTIGGPRYFELVQ
ncbi:hypothetical protein [Zooshikella harenae]|uniref:Uncharacterized protein n=1 Tax=Zooshikella harenae TaxID=2827238 RepID=A0ABS5ZAC6_9GAMM|nr:hypothetical protein [Zooshikella harenae]MBU2711007.1 hypothetical protein [Zooshikella harenae]